MMDFFSRWKEAAIFREPGKPGRGQLGVLNRRDLVLLSLFAALLCLCSLFFASYRSAPLALGLAAFVLLKMVAELLPKDRRMLAGVLRLGSGIAFALGIAGTMLLILVGR